MEHALRLKDNFSVAVRKALEGIYVNTSTPVSVHLALGKENVKIYGRTHTGVSVVTVITVPIAQSITPAMTDLAKMEDNVSILEMGRTRVNVTLPKRDTMATSAKITTFVS